MDATNKLQTIATQMHLEPAEETRIPLHMVNTPIAPCGIPVPQNKVQSDHIRQRESLGVFNAVAGGKTVPLLKTMLTTACERDCYYCPFRAGRNYRRTTFKPEQLANTFNDMHKAGLVNGIFLSSGIIRGGVTAQDKLLDAVDIMRRKHRFKGYIHLKIMPGAEKAQVERAMQLADRLSVNLEAPTTDRLQRLAPKKFLIEELLRPLQWIEEIRQNQSPRMGWNGRFPSTVTQFVVGAVEDTDLELMTAANYLYNKLRLRRTYFSAFRPIADTPLENLSATPKIREHRLYQASFLLRDYGWDMESLPFENAGNLPLDRDPKQAWADTHLAHTPVELNYADRQQLIQVPGIGPKGADHIIKARRQRKLTDVAHLRSLRIAPNRLLPYILLDGKRPAQQLSLF